MKKYREAKRTILYQSDLEKNIGIASCAFLFGAIMCFGALVQMGVL